LGTVHPLARDAITILISLTGQIKEKKQTRFTGKQWAKLAVYVA